MYFCVSLTLLTKTKSKSSHIKWFKFPNFLYLFRESGTFRPDRWSIDTNWNWFDSIDLPLLGFCRRFPTRWSAASLQYRHRTSVAISAKMCTPLRTESTQVCLIYIYIVSVRSCLSCLAFSKKKKQKQCRIWLLFKSLRKIFLFFYFLFLVCSQPYTSCLRLWDWVVSFSHF